MQTDFVKPLLIWYNAAKRDLPWRATRDPYHIWVSEIMLQQTRVEAVRGYYERFLEALPDVRALADCSDDALMKLWEGLGYYSRARNLKRAAQVIVRDRGGAFPETREELLTLPGIGSYTAGAVASIAFGEAVPAVDGNVLRVYARMTALRENILSPSVKREAEAALETVMKEVPDISAGDFNQALIELGAVVCAPNVEPRCAACPVREYCEAHRMKLTGELPVRIKKTGRRIEKRTVLLVRDGQHVAILRRPERGLLAGLYEFPNEIGHLTPEEAVSYVEERGYEALHVRPLREAKHIFSHVEWHMIGYEIRIGTGEGGDSSWIFAETAEIRRERAIPSAFSAYADCLSLRIGKEKEETS